jgi:phosphate acyltransferase
MRAKIAVDAMGGDHAPEEIVKGAIKAQSELNVEITLVGDPQRIQSVVRHLGSEYQAPLTIEPAEEAVAMDEDAITALRRKPRASINVAMNLVKQGKADAVVSAGHSGAVMAAGLLRLGRLPGIDRPALGALLPTRMPGKQVLILDVGANVDCRPKFLEQFAILGSIYSQDVLGVAEPRVGLLNIGEESSKGNDLALRSYSLLENNAHIAFAGNAEGRDVLTGQFDVVVCDGFVGNVLLKFAEAIGGVLLGVIKDELPRGRRGKIGARILRTNLKRIKQRVDHVEHGGALLLGVNGICIIGHGSSYAPSIYSAIRLAKNAVEHQIMDHLHQVKQWTDTDSLGAAKAETSAVS